MLDLTVVLPVRNAEALLVGCLDSIVRAAPREIIVVDGLSSDRTLEIAARYPVRILSDEGQGVAAARALGVQAATSRRVALIDADIVLPDGALARLFDEYRSGGYTALQFGLESTSGPGYWGRALVNHHRNGRSRHWPGVMGTIFERATLLEHGFDRSFLSGEDIELRWRLQQAGAKLGVSQRAVVEHRYGDTFEFARGQWLPDGHGLGRMLRKHGWRAWALAGLPVAACGRGIMLSLLRVQPIWLPYYMCYMVFNYAGMLDELIRRRGSAVHPAQAASRP